MTMTKKGTLFFILIILLVSCTPVTAPLVKEEFKPSPKSSKQVELIKSYVQSFPAETQLSMAVIKNGKVYFRGVKRSDAGIHSINNEDRVFEIGSITKVFTSTLLAHMVNKGILKLEDYIHDGGEKESNLKEKITFLQLSNHTSGLPRLPSNLNLFTADPNNPYKNYDATMLTEYFVHDAKVSHSPGLKYEYSNLGAGTLGYLLAQRVGSTFEDLLNDHITSKYGMMSTTTSREKIDSKLLITGLNNEGKETSHWDLNVLVGAGGILSSVKDMSKFALAQFNPVNKDLQLTHAATFKINENLDSGLGWMIVNTTVGNKWLVHNGGTGGYSSSMVLDVAQKNGIIILSNVSTYHKDTGNIEKLCFELMKTMY